MATTAEIAALALDVLEKEMILTNTRALHAGVPMFLVGDLGAAQAAYEAAILTRTNAVGATT
jgi:hypothetical protein